MDSISDYAKVTEILSALEGSHHRGRFLEAVSRRTGMSEESLQGLLQRWAGVGVRDFLDVLSIQYTKQLLQDSGPVLHSGPGVAFGESQSFPGLSITTEAITPSEYPHRCTSLRIHWGIQPTPFGAALVGVAGGALCHLVFLPSSRSVEDAEAVRDLERHWPGVPIAHSQKRTADIPRVLFTPRRTPETSSPISLLLKGTVFQLKVWTALIKLPFGAVTTYGRLAADLGTPGASRAVGSAVAANSIGYLVPCHRVVRHTGRIGEYRWGAVRKMAMLAWEACSRKP